MSLPSLFALALALAMDAFAVAVATGVHLGSVTGRQIFRLCFHFGLFQALMPVAGWFLGLTVRDVIEEWDHWAAFALLTFIGVHMLREAVSHNSEGREAKPRPAADPTRGLSLLMLSVATSIDALAVGLSFSLLNMAPWFPAVVIGVVCCALSALGLGLGTILTRAALLGRRAELAGGLTLLAIGFKILCDHGALGL
ncbi:MAG: manganese efflux pump [Desulfovibrionaceae bacterium]|nr:manganese efflux pump [Desulfovibrionaceae bacterium]